MDVAIVDVLRCVRFAELGHISSVCLRYADAVRASVRVSEIRLTSACTRHVYYALRVKGEGAFSAVLRDKARGWSIGANSPEETHVMLRQLLPMRNVLSLHSSTLRFRGLVSRENNLCFLRFLRLALALRTLARVEIRFGEASSHSASAREVQLLTRPMDEGVNKCRLGSAPPEFAGTAVDGFRPLLNQIQLDRSLGRDDFTNSTWHVAMHVLCGQPVPEPPKQTPRAQKQLMAVLPEVQPSTVHNGWFVIFADTPEWSASCAWINVEMSYLWGSRRHKRHGDTGCDAARLKRARV